MQARCRPKLWAPASRQVPNAADVHPGKSRGHIRSRLIPTLIIGVAESWFNSLMIYDNGGENT
jgi:hypothetical protein